MFIKVRLLNGFTEPLWYRRPDSWQPASLMGTIVLVPLRNTKVSALVIQESTTAPNVAFALKEASEIEPVPTDPHYAPFITQLSSYYQINPLHLVKRMRLFLHQKEIKMTAKQDAPRIPQAMVQLTPEQQEVVAALAPHIVTPSYHPAVLHGVTGSGKTEVYKNLMQTAINAGKSVILLLPEVTLAIEFEQRLRSELPSDITLCSFHSATPMKQKRLLWQRLLRQDATIIIGVHLPILLPIANLGFIIIDEEHESGYQEKKHPKINSKEAALWRAKMCGIPILLGSATPSVSTLYNVTARGWKLFTLRQRFAGALPTIKTVFLTDGKQRKNFWISTELQRAITDRLAKKEQIIIFLNRRGFSFFVQCKACSFIMRCNSCSVSLTLHDPPLDFTSLHSGQSEDSVLPNVLSERDASRRIHLANKNSLGTPAAAREAMADTQDRRELTCHYCDYKCALPKQCPSCKKESFINKGIGTQQAVTILASMFPQARIARADLDITLKKKQWQQTMRDFDQGSIDMLVGTQTITKGYHFPRVTLVGILWADLNLHFPIYNAAETSLQQLIQVAGRAGRQSPESLVIVQAMGDHRIFSYLNEIDYLNFYADELESREIIGYPPCKRLVEIELKHHDETVLERDAHALATQLSLSPHAAQVQLLGPAKPPVHKIKNTFSRKIYLKGEHIKHMIDMFRSINHATFSSSIFFTPNPTS